MSLFSIKKISQLKKKLLKGNYYDRLHSHDQKHSVQRLNWMQFKFFFRNRRMLHLIIISFKMANYFRKIQGFWS